MSSAGTPWPQNPVTSVDTASVAGWSPPVWASLVDSLILAVPALATWNLNGFWSQAIGLALTIAYEAVLLATWGRTVGMKLLHIRVVPADGGDRIGAGRSWIRALVFNAPLGIPVFGGVWLVIDLLGALRDRPLRQTLHDKAARTVVVRA